MKAYRKVRLVYSGRPVEVGQAITCPADAAGKIRKEFEVEPVEVFFAITLDNRKRVISYETISRGSSEATLVHPREVFRVAIIQGAAAIIVGHNHPSGVCVASQEDKELTKRLVKIGNLIGIPVLDHVIVGHESHISMKDDYSNLWSER